HPFSRSSACSGVCDSGDRTRRAIRSGGVSAWRGRAGGATITKIQHPAIAKRIRRDISMPPEFKELDALTIAAARAEIKFPLDLMPPTAQPARDSINGLTF